MEKYKYKNQILLRGGRVADPDKKYLSYADVLIGKDGIIKKVTDGIDYEYGTLVVECYGCVIAPGFVDAHVHIESSMVLPRAFSRAVMRQGTTTVIADPHEVVNVAGARGLRRFLDETDKAGIGIYTVIPSCVPATGLDTNGAGKFTAAGMKEFLDDKRIVGLGEVMDFYSVANKDPEMMEKLALFKGRTIDGHTVGMPSGMLDAYIAAGISNDHECSDASSMLERYEKGMDIYIREGSAARNAKELLQCIKDNGLDLSRFAFCTDDKHLSTIASEGHISTIVRMALGMGFSWPDVVRMASYNPCKFYGIENRGLVREGYKADLVLCDEACNNIYRVIKDGNIAYTSSNDNPDYNYLDESSASEDLWENTVRFKDLSADDFRLPDNLRNIAIGLNEGQLLTDKIENADPQDKDVCLLATVERYGKNGNMAVCLLKGYGIRDGAVATSVSHDSHNVVCAGDNPSDMAAACNRLKEIGGGYVIVSRGEIKGEFPLPAYGLMSCLDAGQAATELARLEEIAHGLGVNPRIDAFITLSFTALPVIPRLRLLDTGLYDVIEQRFV